MFSMIGAIMKLIRNLLVFQLCLILSCVYSATTQLNRRPFKILHLTYHMGCLKEIEKVAQELSLDITPWFILTNCKEFDGQTSTNAIYNISHERAENIWNRHKDIFDMYDAILISDTAPLSRIFLQHHWKKPLIIWVCNRFDYYDEVTNDGGFPDAEYYDLFRKAYYLPNVHIVSSTPYEYIHAAVHGVPIGDRVIRSIGSRETNYRNGNQPYIPASVNKEETLMLPNMAIFTDFGSTQYIVHQCRSHGINVYSGRYNGPYELKEFKGILYFPYQWWTASMYENIQMGLIHFVPSKTFVENSAKEGKLIIRGYNYCCFNPLFYEYGEFYCLENRDCFVYFDSWQDLAQKIRTTDYQAKKEYILNFADNHRNTMLSRWKELFDNIQATQ